MFGLAKKEIIFVFSLWVLLNLLMSLPYIYAYQTAPKNFVFTGNFKNLGDFNNYFSFIKQAVDGSILFKDLHTPEPHRATYFNLEFLLIGKTASLTGLSINQAFHLWRVFGSLVLLVCFYRLSKEYFPDFYTRGWLLVFFSLGNSWGWLRVVRHLFFGQSGLLPWYQYTFLPWYTYSGAHPFYQMFASAHTVWANALNILGVFWFIQGLKTDKSSAFWISGGIIFITGLFRPFGLMFYVGFVVIWGLISLLQKQLTRHAFLNYCRCLCLPFLVLLYNFFFIKFDPIFKWYSIQSRSMTPSIGALVFNFGLPFLLALGGIIYSNWGRKSSFQDQLLYLWLGLVIVFVCSYKVIVYGFQFISLANPPLYLLAGALIFPKVNQAANRRSIIEMFSNPKCKTAVLFILLVLSSITSFYSLYEISKNALFSNAYIHKDWLKASAWIEENTAKDAKLISSPYSSNYLPRYTGRTVFAGYEFGVVNYNRKIRMLKKFLSWSDLNFNRNLLRVWQIDYVFVSWRDKQPAPSTAFLQKVYKNNNVTIFKVLSDKP